MVGDEKTPLQASRARQRRTRLALCLALFTLAYCLAEGVLAVTFAALDRSVSLMLLGLDSLIEVASAGLVLRHLLGRPPPPAAERRVVGAIGCLLLLLAAAAVAASTAALARREAPETALPAVVISSISAALLAALYVLKHRLAKQLGSPVLAADAACSFACARLSLLLLLGSVLYGQVPGAWWVDAAAALVLACFFAWEGASMLRHAMSPEFQAGGGCGCG